MRIVQRTRKSWIRAVAMSAVAALLLVGCGSGDEPAPAPEPAGEAPEPEEPDEGDEQAEPGEVVTLTYATTLDESSAYYAGAVALAEAADELSGGRLQIEIFHSGQLAGSDRELIEGMQLGTIDLASPSTGAMGEVVPEATVLDLPYIFDGPEHVYRTLDGPVGEQIADLFDGKGFRPLGYWEIGFRNLTNNLRPVTHPDDLQGMALRTLPSEIHQEAWRLAGAQPQAIDFTELYNALDTGVVDGQENPFNIILTGNLYEVQQYLSVTRHVYGTAPTSVSDVTWASLDPELQEILVEAVAISVVAQREAASGNEAGQLEQLIEFGMEVEENPDRDAFREAMSGAWDLYIDRFGDDGQALIDSIRAQAS
jgi:TRAP-type transport system periplasmic protein